MRRIAIVTLLVVVVLVVPLLLSSRSHRPSAGAVAEAPPPAPPAPTVAAPPPLPPPPTIDDRRSPVTSLGTGEATDQTPRAHARNVTYDQYRAQLDRRFEEEHADPGWSASASSRLAQQLVALLPAGSELVDVDCRASMCRVRASHQDRPSFDLFSRTMVQITVDDWTGGMLVTEAKEEGAPSHATIAYLGRSGTPLPEAVEPLAE